MHTTVTGTPAAREYRPTDSPMTLGDGAFVNQQSDVIRVLLVEDTPMNQRLATMVLKTMGATVDLAENGSEGVRQRQNGSHDLILMDLQMPILDGLRATQQIRQWETQNGQPNIPIVAMTAHGMEADRVQCLAAGMNAFLVKPVPLAEYQSVLDICREKKLARQLNPSMSPSAPSPEPIGAPKLLDLPRAHAFVGDAAGVMSMLPALAASLEADLPEIDRFLSIGDVASANRLLHPLKGFIPVFCVDAVIDQVTSVEILSKSADASQVWQAFTKIRPLLDQLSKEVRSLLDHSGDSQHQNSVGNAPGNFI